MTYDHVIRNGRVIDPETGFDEICDVAVKDGIIVAVGTDLGTAGREIDATGLVVSPGFIDLHGHGQSVAADRMQAFDGVTTSLELEIGALPAIVHGDFKVSARKLCAGMLTARGVGVDPQTRAGDTLAGDHLNAVDLHVGGRGVLPR